MKLLSSGNNVKQENENMYKNLKTLLTPIYPFLFLFNNQRLFTLSFPNSVYSKFLNKDKTLFCVSLFASSVSEKSEQEMIISTDVALTLLVDLDCCYVAF